LIIRSRAPVRIAFGGGGTDLAPFCNDFGGCIISSTINKYIYVTLVPRNDNNVNIISVDYKRSLSFQNISEIKINGDIDLIKAVILRMKPEYGFDLLLRSDIPPNTGLGSSGSVAVAAIGVFNHLRKEDRLDNYDIAELAYKIESEDLNNAGGRQDQYAATFGGINFIQFNGDGLVKVIPVKIDKDYIFELEKHLVLAYVGARGASGKIQSILVDQQIKNNSEKLSDKTKILLELKEICNDMYNALARGHLDYFGKLLDKSWQIKKSLSNKISSHSIDNIYMQVKESGAIGGKITGAGGGGCMVFFAKSNKEHLIVDTLTKLGSQVIDFSFEMDGLVTWELEKKNRRLT